jgi:hypothetical protein
MLVFFLQPKDIVSASQNPIALNRADRQKDISIAPNYPAPPEFPKSRKLPVLC